ncbi:hypothetical protein [Actinomyces respiraculi]|uniref:hypothetical protein n=1 Tax=Actinomyces respiraculi TaxID=2744574 RepID=UPI00141FB5A3|nr:hypothetical protein [Actinomyces respiraculi]
MTLGPHCPTRTRVLRALATGLCLTSCLTGLAACSSGGDDSGTEVGTAPSADGGVLSAATARPSIEQTRLPSPTATASTASGGLGTRPTDAPKVQPTASWTPPEVHFYNENWSYWYQDDSVTNQNSITSQGNFEGYRTHVGTCIGFATRDIDEATHLSGLSDEVLSASLLDGSTNMDIFTETSRERISVVRDDGGTLEGYNVTYTGTYTWADGPGEIHGYRFARTVSNAGLNFVVMLICRAGDEMTLEQWHEVLAGMRLTGVSGGPMGE